MAENDKFIKNENERGNNRNRDNSRSGGAKKTAAMTKTHEICELCAQFRFNSFV